MQGSLAPRLARAIARRVEVLRCCPEKISHLWGREAVRERSLLTRLIAEELEHYASLLRKNASPDSHSTNFEGAP